VHRERLEKAGWKVGDAAEFLDLRRDPEFWKMIESRRASKRPPLSEAEVRRYFGIPKRPRATRRR
jgi:hypothetical protein